VCVREAPLKKKESRREANKRDAAPKVDVQPYRTETQKTDVARRRSEETKKENERKEMKDKEIAQASKCQTRSLSPYTFVSTDNPLAYAFAVKGFYTPASLSSLSTSLRCMNP
jgi:hypothetical protein